LSILVLGTVALDTVRTPFGVRKNMLGGSAVHFAMSCRLFTEVHVAASVGRDFPVEHISFLKRKGINLQSLIQESGSTFAWEGEYKGDLNTALTLNTQLGVLSTFKPLVSEGQRNIPYVFLANVDPDIQMQLLSRMRSVRLVGLDSMNFWIQNKRKALLRALKKVDLYVANDQEARFLSGETNLLAAAKRLRSLGPAMVLIKKGEHGLFFYSDKFLCALPAFPRERVIDPTGAGDTFAGGFMGYLAKTRSLEEKAIRRGLAFGTVAASFNVEDFGVGSTSRMTAADLKSRLASFKRLVSF